MSIIINIIKILFLLGFLVFIHEGGHFLVAKACKINVKEFSLGFGNKIWSKEHNGTLYAIRMIPLGGYVNLLGENSQVDEKGSFSSAKVWKRILIVMAGAVVNIIFGLLLYYILAVCYNINNPNISENALYFGFEKTVDLLSSLKDGLAMLFTGNISINQMSGPIGISEMAAKTNGMFDFLYLLSIVSISLGVTNLLPFPALDGGKILLLLIEAITRKKISEKFELQIQSIGFIFLVLLSIYISINDVKNLF